ncbi:clumping factor A-like isoform X2 [Ptychodera flava]|uniref:clumping factor A-like isoform X2 n=1 Tax=Ptychodera flava TaxID=63121 RepID=UPI00396A8153
MMANDRFIVMVPKIPTIRKEQGMANGPRGTGNGHETSDSDGAKVVDIQQVPRQSNGSRTPGDAKRPIHSDPGPENVDNQQGDGGDNSSRDTDSALLPGDSGTPENVDQQDTRDHNNHGSSYSDGQENDDNQQATVNSNGFSGADHDAQGQSSENDNRRRPTDVKRPGDIATGSDYQSSLGETSGHGASLHYTDMSNAEVSRFNGNPVQSSENAAISSDMDAQIFEDFTFNIAAYPDIQRENGDHDYSEYQEGTIGSDTFEKELSRQQSHEHDVGGNGHSNDDTTVTESGVDEEGRAQSSQTTPVSSPSAAGTTDGAANGNQSGREGKEGGKGGKGEDEKYR